MTELSILAFSLALSPSPWHRYPLPPLLIKLHNASGHAKDNSNYYIIIVCQNPLIKKYMHAFGKQGR